MASVEGISMSLVREFLNRKGLKTTLQSMDLECPRTADSINSRTVLCKALHVERLVRKNKELATPLKTIIEVMVEYFIDKGKKSHEVASNKETEATSRLVTTVTSSSVIPNQTLFSDDKTIHLSSTIEDSHPQASLKLGTEYEKLLQEDDEKPVISSSILPMEHQKVHDDCRAYLTKSHNTTAISASTSPKAVTSLSSRHSSRHKQVMVSRTTQPVIVSSSSSSKSKKAKPLRLSHKLKERIYEGKEKVEEDPATQQSLVEPILSPITKPVATTDQRRLMHECTNTTTNIPHSKKDKPRDHVMELSLEDISDSDVQHLSAPATGGLISHPQQTLVDGKLVTKETAKQLRKLLFGSSKGYFNAEWVGQNFVFSTTPGLEYGLVQHKGGPCGVLATVQAYILKHVLFTSSSSVVTSVKDRNNTLIHAMIDILWKVKSSSSVILAFPSVHLSSLAGDIIDQLVLYEKSNTDEIMESLQQNLNYFTGTGQPGCILLLISAVLTRGIQCILNDMDEPTNKLIGRHSYCTQDLVNLLLVGRAVSNTHNGVITLGTGNESTQLKGIHCQSEIGFLSLFEHYKTCTVGTHYKHPQYPIWIVCSESHFCVLFNPSRDFFVRNPVCFDLIYYDGLGEQDKEIRLTIDTSHKTQVISEEDDDLMPPLELCIKTCWNGAHIDWNGTNPLL